MMKMVRPTDIDALELKEYHQKLIFHTEYYSSYFIDVIILFVIAIFPLKFVTNKNYDEVNSKKLFGNTAKDDWINPIKQIRLVIEEIFNFILKFTAWK